MDIDEFVALSVKHNACYDSPTYTFIRTTEHE